MATKQYLGHLSTFQCESETISAYLERVQLFFDVNGIKEDKKKVPVFLNAVSSRTYALLRDYSMIIHLSDRSQAINHYLGP